MSGLFPIRSDVSSREDGALVVDLSSEEADEVFAVLSSSTARRTLAALYDEPRTASDLAERLDLSLQNVGYHLGNLRDAGLIEVVDTWYSETGNEMKVYAPTATAVMVLSDRSAADRFRELLGRVFTVFVALGVATLVFRSVLVNWLLPGIDTSVGQERPATEDAEATEVPMADPEPTSMGPEELLEALPVLLDPGIVFFLGGLFTLLAVLGLRWYLRA